MVARHVLLGMGSLGSLVRHLAMPRLPVSASFTASWLIHDSWTESYIGVRRLVYELLPHPGSGQAAEDGALCQLALIGANHLVEVALLKILKPFVSTTDDAIQLSPSKLDRASYFDMLNEWIPKVTAKQIDTTVEPFVSTERLRHRRHATVHKTSALATVQMARSALHSAVGATKALYMHAGTPFPYDAHLAKYPQVTEPPFSTIPFPPIN